MKTDKKSVTTTQTETTEAIQLQFGVSKPQAIAFMHQIARMYGYTVIEP